MVDPDYLNQENVELVDSVPVGYRLGALKGALHICDFATFAVAWARFTDSHGPRDAGTSKARKVSGAKSGRARSTRLSCLNSVGA